MAACLYAASRKCGNMKTTITRLLKILALLLPVALFVLFMQSYVFCDLDQSTERIRRFYEEEKNSLDVVFLGAGDVSTAFAPGLAYEKFGFTSYLYTVDANPASLYKYQLKEVLSTQNPQAIFVELNGFLYDDSYQTEDARLQTFAENIPFSLNKLEVIHQYDAKDKLSILFPFLRYHGDWVKGNRLIEMYNWKTVKAKGPSMWKGITCCTKVTPMDPAVLSGPNPSIPEKNVLANAYLIDFLEFCREEELSNIIFVRFPHRNYASFYNAVAHTEQILADYGYPLLNLEEKHEEIGLDFNRDFYDDEHTNIYGMEKMTMYLGAYLVNEVLGEPKQQSDENAARWAQWAKDYHIYHDYNYAMIERNYEAWPGEEPYEMMLIEAWLEESGTA